MQLTIEGESENNINFLHIKISKDKNNVQFTVFRKAKATDIIFPNDSCYPPEYKLAAFSYLISRMPTYPKNYFGKTK
jgi:hypothetical protein